LFRGSAAAQCGKALRLSGLRRFLSFILRLSLRMKKKKVKGPDR
jgi:hypothetical protein